MKPGSNKALITEHWTQIIDTGPTKKQLQLIKYIQGVFCVWCIPYNCHFFTMTQFLENKIYTQKTRKLRQNTQKIAHFLRYYGKIHSKLPIFRVKSVKIYTCQKNLHWRRRPRRRQLSGMCSILPTQYAVDIYGWDWMKSWFGNNNLLRDLRYVLVYSINSQKSFEVVQVLFF